MCLHTRHSECAANGMAEEGNDQTVCLKMSLTRPEKFWQPRLGNPKSMADAMFGLYVLLDESGARTSRAHLTRNLDETSGLQVVHETCFSPSCEISCTLELQLASAARLLLVPTTFEPGQLGPFLITVHSTHPITLAECS